MREGGPIVASDPGPQIPVTGPDYYIKDDLYF